MATINLGRVKPVFRGAYSGGTAYVVDDIVTSGNETFICIQASTGNATSNASYWTKLAAKGTDGTDISTTLTTQGDILYRDGSGLQRLAAGTSGHVLTTGGSGANPSWAAAVGGKVLQVVQTKFPGNSISTTSGSFQNFGYTRTITPSATTSKVFGIVTMNGFWISNASANNIVNIERQISGGSNTDLTSQNLGLAHTYNTDAITASFSFLDSPSTTSEITYNPRFRTDNSNYTAYVHRSTCESSIILMEIGA